MLAQRAGVHLASLRHTILETGVLAQAMAPFDLRGSAPFRADEAAARASMEHLLRLADKDLDHTLELVTHVVAELPVIAATRKSFWSVARLAEPGATA